MAELPVLKGRVSKDMVKKIGSGTYAAEYVPWSKIAELMQVHAPGWMPECVPNADGDILHRAPVGGYLQIRFRHLDGTVTPAYPQAVQDNRHKSVAYDKISSRDITDTQRRGWCLAAAAVFGIGVEMWTRDPLESGYSAPDSAPDSAPKSQVAPVVTPAAPAAASGGTSEVTEANFREAALDKGFTTYAVEGLLGLIKGDYAKGVKTVGNKTAAEVEGLNAKFAPKEESGEGEQW